MLLHMGSSQARQSKYTKNLKMTTELDAIIIERFAKRKSVNFRLTHAHTRPIDTWSDIDWYQKSPGSCSSHLLNPARDRNMQIRRDPYSLESTRLDPQNRGFTRVARGE